MSTSDDEKCVNKSKIDYNELPKLKTKILNKKYTREILNYYIKEKKVIIKYLKEKLEKEKRKLQVLEYNLKEKLKKEERELQVLEYDLEKFDLSQKINEE